MSDAPWWGSGALILSGAVIAAIISMISVKLSDGRKAKREDEQRWDNELLLRAAKLTNTLNRAHATNAEYQRVTNEMIQDRDQSKKEKYYEIKSAAGVALRAYTDAAEELLLIAPANVSKTMNDLNNAFLSDQAKAFVAPAPDNSPDPLLSSAFVKAVRSAAGVPMFGRDKKRRSRK